MKPTDGPGPASYGKPEIKETDLLPEFLSPGLLTLPPEKAPFQTSEPRFMNLEMFEKMEQPAPTDYDIPRFAETMIRDLIRHQPACINPRLGFLSSAVARPPRKDKREINVTQPTSPCERRCWRNVRPPKYRTYPYNGPPERLPVCKAGIGVS